uniref:Uncharacterized protein n=1 Tax=Caenorhabditis japonica TaxID=281687 RepID=A0A8R1I260_CAEJA
MSKAANFSFIGDLPTYQTSRHCCRLVKVTTLYYLLTYLLILQLVLLLFFCLLPEMDGAMKTFFLPPIFEDESKNSLKFKMQLLVAFGTVIWFSLITLSFVGHSKKNIYLHLPLIVLEFSISFCLLSAAGIALFIWKIGSKPGNRQNQQQLLTRCFVFSALFIFHAYYVFVLVLLQKDVKAKNKTEKFIARQQMIDEVCEEMAWEEEESEKYRALPLSNVYYHHREASISYSDGSLCSQELNTIYMSHQLQQAHRRFVTFYDEDEESY